MIYLFKPQIFKILITIIFNNNNGKIKIFKRQFTKIKRIIQQRMKNVKKSKINFIIFEINNKMSEIKHENV